MMSHTEMARNLGIAIEDVYSSLRKLEEYDMIRIIADRCFTSLFSKELDDQYEQNYDQY